jgi:hypothetical protein
MHFVDLHCCKVEANQLSVAREVPAKLQETLSRSTLTSACDVLAQSSQANDQVLAAMKIEQNIPRY